MTTIKMVAERAGVSTATVSRALSDPGLVHPETRDRVRDAIAALGYSPNSAAKSLRTLRTNRIVVMVPDVANPFFSEVLRGAEDAAQEAGYSVLLGDTRDDAAREAQYAEMLLRKDADGLIFLGHRLPAALAPIVAVRGAAAPVVNGCDFAEALGVSSVHIDNAAAAMAAMERLYMLGHRRVAIIAGTLESHITRERLRGVRTAAERAAASDSLTVSHGAYTIEFGRESTEALLDAPIPPTAIFCFSDELAVGALAACRARQLACPADISVIGFDDIRYAQFLDPPLTTVRQPMNAIGAGAVNLLLRIIEGELSKPEWITLDYELVERGSTGPVPTH